MAETRPALTVRSAYLPDGSRISVAYDRGSHFDHLTDEQFAAEMEAMRTRLPAEDEAKPDTLADQVDEPITPEQWLALEQIRQHPPGQPFTADEFEPICTQQGRDSGAPAQLAALLNHVLLPRLQQP